MRVREGSLAPPLRGRGGVAVKGWGAVVVKARVNGRWREREVRVGAESVGFKTFMDTRNDSWRRFDGDRKKDLLKECRAATRCSCMIYACTRE